MAVAQSAPIAPTFRDFSGFCQGGADTPLMNTAVSWDRHDLSWGSLEPVKGEWHQDVLDKFGQQVLEYKKKHANVLPILDFNTGWSMESDDRSFVFNRERIEFKKQPDGTWVKSVFKPNEKTPTTQPVTPNSNWPLASDHVADWQNYVRRVVTFLHQPPYNVQYFQIWNEAHPASGFWDGSLDDYMTRVHLPAAKVIRDAGAKVVYGGYPCCGSLSTLVELLDKHHAWQSLDVLDIHYFPVSAFQFLRNAADQRGFKDLALWQTEIGFTADPTFVANTYPRFLDWALANNWNKPDKYKLFLFAYWAPDDPKAYGYGRALMAGKNPSAHGTNLQTLATLLSGGPLKRFTQVQSVPVLKPETDERLSSLEAFEVGKQRIVIAAHISPNNDAKIMTDWHGSGDSIHIAEGAPVLSLKVLGAEAAKVLGAERVDLAGNRSELTIEHSGGQIDLDVPIRDTKDGLAAKWNDQNKQAQTFYVLLTLAN